MAVGLKDVARLAGVSAKTVSNVVHDHPHVTPATRQRVRAAIEELGYRPDRFARSLRTGRTGVIALAVPAVDNPYYAELTRLVVEQAETRSWTVLVDQTEGSPARERLVLDGIRDHMIDGLLLVPRAVSATELARRPAEVPVVLLGEQVRDAGLDRVSVDGRAVARDATAHLLGRGRTRVAALGVGGGDVMAGERLAGYRDALAAAGLVADPALEVAVGQWGHAEGQQATTALLARVGDLDGLVCFNDALALGALHALQQQRRRIPADVAVVGVDDVPAARYLWPPLSSVRLDKPAIARAAVELLAERIADPARAPRTVTVGHELVARVSTLGP